MPNRFPWIAVLRALAAAAQGTRPEAAVFDMSRLHMEALPPAGVAIRAGRLRHRGAARCDQ
ncbi:MAG TPA: hypothetical protein VIY49_04890 [Bryobacteraceae bacterium]